MAHGRKNDLRVFDVFHSCARYQSSESTAGHAARHRRAAGVLRGGVPQHHQLLGQKPRRDASQWVSKHASIYTM